MDRDFKCYQQWLAQMRFPPGWSVTVSRLSSLFEHRLQVRIVMMAPDSYNPDTEVRLEQRAEIHDPAMFGGDLTEMEREFVREIQRVCRERVLHELDEWLRYKGELLHDPHAPVSRMFDLFAPRSGEVNV